MEKNQIKNKILSKYNCSIDKKSAELFSFHEYKKNMSLQVALKEYSKNEFDSMFHSALVEKLIRNLMKKGKKYTVRKHILKGFKNFKHIVKINPLAMYFHIIFYFIILIEFKSRQKSGKIIRVPRPIRSQDTSLARTIKLFSKTLKSNWDIGTDLQTKTFLEMYNLTYFIKRSRFYNTNLTKYYNDSIESLKHIGYKW